MFHASTNDVEPISIMCSVVFRSSWFKGLNGKCPAYVIGTVTDNETINQRFYDSGTASQRRKEKREEAQWRQWEADAPLREAEAAREKSEREEYERKQQEFHDVLCAGYIRACEANGNQPDKVGFMEVITAKYPKAPRIADLGMAIAQGRLPQQSAERPCFRWRRENHWQRSQTQDDTRSGRETFLRTVCLGPQW